MNLYKSLCGLVVVFFLGGFSQQASADEWIYSFRPGDTLWDLCKKYIAAPDCWQKIATRNKIAKPKHIKPGTRLYLPISWLKVLPASAKVLSARGDVMVKRAGDETLQPLAVDNEIAVGDQIITSEGTVTLQFADESILIITPGSEVAFDTLTLYGESGMVDTRVRLNRGRARAKVKPVEGPASRYEILTPAAVAAVRGTEFRVVSEDTDPPQMRAEVLEGQVALGNDKGEQAVNEGYALKAVSGEALQEPVQLLPAPSFTTQLPEVISAFPWRLAWQPIDRAAAYRVQIYSRGFFFDDLIQEAKISRANFSLQQLEEGQYDIKVRAIDRNGFEGMDAKYFVAVAGSRQVKPVSVDSDVVVSEERTLIHWHWQPVDGAEKYLLQLTAKASGEERQVEVVEPYFEQAVAGPGEYQLQVAPVIGKQILAYGERENVTIRDSDQPPPWAQAIVFLTILLAIF